MPQASTIVEVVDFKTKMRSRLTIDTTGQEVFKFLRKRYPKFSKFVIMGFVIDNKLKQINLRPRS